MGFRFSITFKDLFNGTISRTFALASATQIDADTISAATLSAVQGLTDLAVVKTELVQFTNIVATAGANANIDRGMTSQFGLGGPKQASINFPSPVISVVNSDRTINQADGLVSALMALYLSGDLLVSDGEVVVDVLGAVLDK